MKRLVILTTSILLIVGCSLLPLSELNPLKDNKGVEVSAQVGKNNTQIKTENKSLLSASSNDRTDVNTTTSSNNRANVVNQSSETNADRSLISTKNDNKTTNDNKAEVINQETSTITNYPIPTWLIIAFAAMSGVAIPNPLDFFRNRRKRREREESNKRMRSEIDYLRGELREHNKTISKQASHIIEKQVATNS